MKHLVLSGFILILGCNEAELSPPIHQPNVVVIMADDLGFGDLSFTGQQKFSTPKIDRLAEEGLFFSQHYSGSTVCAPSRSSFMTGLHTGHTYIRGNKEVKPEGQFPLPDSIYTLAEIAREAGYITGAIGKWGLGAPGSSGDPIFQGFDHFFGYNCQRLAHNYYTEYLWNNRDTVILEGNEKGGIDYYAPDVIHQQALNFIDEYKDTTFFLFLPYTIPHAELLVPEDSLMEKYRGRFEENTYSGVDEGERFRKGPYGSQSHPRAAFAAMIERLDHQVGEIIERLEEHGLSENTLVVFTSDNGPHREGGADPEFFNSNGGLRGIKRDLYEGGIKVPTIAYWPSKIKPGRSTTHISAFWDFYPTLCQLFGIEIPNNLDGVSFLPTLLDTGDQQIHDYLYWEFHEQGGKQAIRKGKWKAIRLDVKKDSLTRMELYDLSIDPSEMNDISSENPEVVSEMQRIFAESRTESEIFKFIH